MQNFIEPIVTYFKNNWMHLAGAAIILIVGLFAMKIVLRITKTALERSKAIDNTLRPFLLSLTRIGLWMLLAVIVMESLGVPTSSLVAALGAIGLAVSLAVKDSLANLLGGVTLLITKPFVVGDYCDIDDQGGTIEEIRFIHTTMTTVDNKRIYIPNGQVVNSVVINHSSAVNRRLNLTFSIGYECDYEQARSAILQVIERNPLALTDPPPLVRMSSHGDSAINLVCRVWVSGDEFWNLHYDLMEGVKSEFDRLGISIPYPQMDVHINQVAKTD